MYIRNAAFAAWRMYLTLGTRGFLFNLGAKGNDGFLSTSNCRKILIYKHDALRIATSEGNFTWRYQVLLFDRAQWLLVREVCDFL